MLAAGGIDIADAFSTDLYTGNGGTQTITNGIDLSGEGGLVWLKSRSSTLPHNLFDTERGRGNYLSSNSTNAQNVYGADSAGRGLSTFNSTGFSLGQNQGSEGNTNATTYVGWTFRKAPKFFDVVTYTGNGATRTIAHDLGVAPGMIVIKALSTTTGWSTYHRSVGATKYLRLNESTAETAWAYAFDNTEPTSSVMTLGSGGGFNSNGQTYVAYIFAHDTDDDGVIQCGSYTGNGSATGPVITLGWEPQWLMIKRSDAAANWHIFDAVRGLTTSTDKSLRPNLSSAEMGVQGTYQATATGFTVNQAYSDYNASGGTYIYMAIRKEGA